VLPFVGYESVVASRSRQSRKRPQALPEPHRPRPALARTGLVVAGAGLGAVTALAITDETLAELRAPGGAATFLGSLTGLVGMYLALLMVLLVSRIPAIERVLGQDGLLRWHRRLAPWPISLLIAHALFITVGYAQAARAGLGHQVAVLLTRYPDVLIATIGPHT
jgi:predicted ferric reductase